MTNEEPYTPEKHQWENDAAAKFQRERYTLLMGMSCVGSPPHAQSNE